MRVAHNKKPIPEKEELLNLYHEQNMNLLSIAKYYGNVSNVTVKKWFKYHSIPLKSHAQIQKENHSHLKYSSFRKKETQEKVKKTFTEKYGVPYHPNNMDSKAEKEILDYLNSLGGQFRKRRIHGIELDGLDDNLGVAFEYCGHHWHNEHSPTPKDRKYHKNKYDICRKNGIRLFTIFEYEWHNSKEQIKNFLRSQIGKNTIRLNARNCEVKILHNKSANYILNNWHIQGAPRNSVLTIALFHEQDIVGLMIFSRHHRDASQVVLSRLCFKPDITIRGGAGKMLRVAQERFDEIITWSDNRWSNGNVYAKLGFLEDSQLPADYFYVKGKYHKSKQSMKKSNIGAGPNQTEYEKAKELGWSRIWDCGKTRWKWSSINSE